MSTVQDLWDAGDPQAPAGFVSWGAKVSELLLTALQPTLTALLNAADQVISRAVMKDYSETVNAKGNVSGAVTINYEDGNVATATLTGNVTGLTISNSPAPGVAGSMTLILTQDATGSRTLTLDPAVYKTAGDAAVVLSTAANAVDILTMLTLNGGTTWYVLVAGQAMA